MSYRAFVVCLVSLLFADAVAAQINVAQGKPIIDGSGSWDGGVVGEGAPFNGGQFPARLAVDGNTNETEGAPNSQWLGREQTLMEYFTLDLEQPIEIDRINLYNTHNRQFNDRGTNEFVIFAADDVDDSNQLIDPIPFLSGELADVSGQNFITPEEFTFPAFTTRYLMFQALTAHDAFNNNVGLNEIEVFAAGNFESPNLALGKPVISNTGSLDGFPASAVTDGSRDDAPGNYWLGRDGIPDNFVLDLEREVDIQEILLRNTHNGTFHDRGTQDFTIFASTGIDGGNNLVNPVEILSSSLYNTTGVSPSFENVFTAENGLTTGPARYLAFQPIDGTYFNGNIGLNEIEVYEEVRHEPTEPPRYNDNIALNKPIVDGSSSWNQQAFDGGDFPAQFAVDGSIADHSAVPSQHWLASEFCPGPDCIDGPDAEAYFTVDLGDLYRIDEITLRNTHNRQFNDRGTEEFVIFGAQEVDASGALIDPVPILSGELARTDGQAPIDPESFTTENGLAPESDFRYLRFQALSHYTSDTNGGAGLNEFEVYGRLVSDLGGGGDFDGDGEYTCADIDALYGGISTGDTAFDLTGDDAVDDGDVDAWLTEAGEAKGFSGPIRRGDADLNGLVDAQDLNTLGINWQSDTLTSWCQADFNHDGVADAADLNFTGINWQSDITAPGAANAVPEPAGLAWVMFATLAIWVSAGIQRTKSRFGP